jgi:predicted nucleic acid-binding protein
MKSIVFDTGPIISLTMNNLLWLLEPLKKLSDANFFITSSVKKELVDTPLNKTKRFMFEALQVQRYIENGTLQIADNEIEEDTSDLLSIANNCFEAFGHNMNIVHEAEMSAIALFLQKDADAFVVDERTTRLLIENPRKLLNILKHTLHTKVKDNKDNLAEFKKITRKIKIIRSVELVTIAYEKGLLDKYLTSTPKNILLESVIWGVKLNGCAVSKRELEQIMRIER